ncbi:MAG: hypothetical protein CSA45_00345 [Gammaproteobacteria bacterium]|nr:MAG: hypothetical protein CSA45_00345 [Gammaproteobacteria bacterium]
MLNKLFPWGIYIGDLRAKAIENTVKSVDCREIPVILAAEAGGFCLRFVEDARLSAVDFIENIALLLAEALIPHQLHIHVFGTENNVHFPNLVRLQKYECYHRYSDDESMQAALIQLAHCSYDRFYRHVSSKRKIPPDDYHLLLIDWDELSEKVVTSETLESLCNHIAKAGFYVIFYQNSQTQSARQRAHFDDIRACFAAIDIDKDHFRLSNELFEFAGWQGYDYQPVSCDKEKIIRNIIIKEEVINAYQNFQARYVNYTDYGDKVFWLLQSQRRPNLKQELQTLIDWAVTCDIPADKFPRDVKTLCTATVLYLRQLPPDRQLTTLPDAIGCLDRLQKLYIEGNQLSALPESLANLSRLQVLNVGWNKLVHLPESLGQLTRLIDLDLRGNRLVTLPETLGDLSQLRELCLGNNRLTELPDSIGKLTHLLECDISFNRCRCLPGSIGRLQQLETLDIRANQLQQLPDSLGGMSSLVMLDLESNELTELPASVGQLSELVTLNLKNNQLTEWPEPLVKLSCLEMLNLADNRIVCLPDNFGELERLVTLSLANNCLRVLPESFPRLVGLETLDIRANQLTKLPQPITALSRLKQFDVANNRLTLLPDDIGSLAQLQQVSPKNRLFHALIKFNLM